METLTPVLIDALLKSVVILLIALTTTLAMRRASAAARHLVWTCAIVSVLALPAIGYLLPGLAILPVAAFGQQSEAVTGAAESAPSSEAAIASIETSNVSAASAARPERLDGEPATAASQHVESPPTTEPAAAPLESDAQAAPALAWPDLLAWLPWIWLGGASFALIPLILGWLSLLHLRRTARPITDGPWHTLYLQLREELNLKRPVALLRSPCRTMPMTWGACPGRPAKVLMPEDADDWSAARRRAVLLHELAHVKRWDGLTQVLSQLACALYWPNPLVWLAAQRMLVERERACDDVVLLHDTKQSDYAEHLLEIATGPQAGFFAAHAGIAMARRSKLDGRLVAILDKHRNRRAMSRLGAAVTIALVGAVALPVAMLQAEGEAVEVDPPRLPRATILDGVHAELLGIGDDIEEPARWWSGRGTVLDRAPTAHPELAELVFFGEMMAPSQAATRGVLLRLKGFKGEPPIVLLDADGAATARSWVAQHDDVVEVKHELKVADGRASTHLRYDVLAGPWETFAATDGRQAMALFTRDVRRLQQVGSSRTIAQTGELRQEGQRGIWFLPAEQERDFLSIAVAHDLLEHLDLRLVVLDNEGRLHEPAETFVRESTRTERQVSFRTFREPNSVIDSRLDDLPDRLTIYRFEPLPLERVAEFRLQTPLTRFEFRNVSLQPGHETEVEIVAGETSRDGEDRPQRLPRNISEGIQPPAYLSVLAEQGLDFDRGRTVSPENDQAAVDATLEGYELVGHGLAAAVVDLPFEIESRRLTAEHVRAAVEQVDSQGGRWSLRADGGEAGSPSTIAFRTRDGTAGVLAVTGYTITRDQGIFRYRLKFRLLKPADQEASSRDGTSDSQEQDAEPAPPQPGAEPEQQAEEERSAMVRVQGEISRPGAYAIPDDGLTLIQLLMAAGNPLNHPDPDSVSVGVVQEMADGSGRLRFAGTLGGLVSGRGVNPYVQGGDIVVVGDALGNTEMERQPLPAADDYVYVGGAVTRPGAFVLPADDLALRTLLISVGFTDEEHSDGLFVDVLRQTPDGRLQAAARIPLATLRAGEEATPILQPGDVVIVRNLVGGNGRHDARPERVSEDDREASSQTLAESIVEMHEYQAENLNEIRRNWTQGIDIWGPQPGVWPEPAEEPRDAAEVVEDLEGLVYLRDRQLRRMQQLLKAGLAESAHVRDAQANLLDARASLAEARGEHEQVVEALEDIVRLRERGVEWVRQLQEQGRMGAADLADAQQRLLEARLRLAEARSRDGTGDSPE